MARVLFCMQHFFYVRYLTFDVWRTTFQNVSAGLQRSTANTKQVSTSYTNNSWNSVYFNSFIVKLVFDNFNTYQPSNLRISKHNFILCRINFCIFAAWNDCCVARSFKAEQSLGYTGRHISARLAAVWKQGMEWRTEINNSLARVTFAKPYFAFWKMCSLKIWQSLGTSSVGSCLAVRWQSKTKSKLNQMWYAASAS